MATLILHAWIAIITQQNGFSFHALPAVVTLKGKRHYHVKHNYIIHYDYIVVVCHEICHDVFNKNSCCLDCLSSQ